MASKERISVEAQLQEIRIELARIIGRTEEQIREIARGQEVSESFVVREFIQLLSGSKGRQVLGIPMHLPHVRRETAEEIPAQFLEMDADAYPGMRRPAPGLPSADFGSANRKKSGATADSGKIIRNHAPTENQRLTINELQKAPLTRSQLMSNLKKVSPSVPEDTWRRVIQRFKNKGIIAFDEKDRFALSQDWEKHFQSNPNGLTVFPVEDRQQKSLISDRYVKAERGKKECSAVVLKLIKKKPYTLEEIRERCKISHPQYAPQAWGAVLSGMKKAKQIRLDENGRVYLN